MSSKPDGCTEGLPRDSIRVRKRQTGHCSPSAIRFHLSSRRRRATIRKRLMGNFGSILGSVQVHKLHRAGTVFYSFFSVKYFNENWTESWSKIWAVPECKPKATEAQRASRFAQYLSCCGIDQLGRRSRTFRGKIVVGV